MNTMNRTACLALLTDGASLMHEALTIHIYEDISEVPDDDAVAAWITTVEECLSTMTDAEKVTLLSKGVDMMNDIITTHIYGDDDIVEPDCGYHAWVNEATAFLAAANISLPA